MSGKRPTLSDVQQALDRNSTLRALNPALIASHRSPATVPLDEKATIGSQKAKKGREMNLTERQFEALLKQAFPGQEILYERYTLKLAHDLRYTPDFAVVHRDGTIIFYEVKGAFIRDRALIKPKMAAEMFNHRFWIAQKIDGQFRNTEIPGKFNHETKPQ